MEHPLVNYKGIKNNKKDDLNELLILSLKGLSYILILLGIWGQSVKRVIYKESKREFLLHGTKTTG